jgi:preprotein translocase subunit SecA
VKNEVTKVLMTVKVQSAEQVEQAAEAMEDRAERISNVTYTAPTVTGEVESQVDPATAGQQRAVAGAVMAAAGGMPRVGRNDPCPCGSGKKFKHCHGQLT